MTTVWTRWVHIAGFKCKDGLRSPPSHSGWVWVATNVCAAYANHQTWQVRCAHTSWKLHKHYFLHVPPVYVCVLSDGNLATKQVVFLQRPVRCQTATQQRNQVSKGASHRDTTYRQLSTDVYYRGTFVMTGPAVLLNSIVVLSEVS